MPNSCITVLGMASRSMWREALIVFAMVVVSAYAAGLLFNLVSGQTPLDQMGVSAGIALGLLLLVIALGFVLWKSTEDEPAL